MQDRVTPILLVVAGLLLTSSVDAQSNRFVRTEPVAGQPVVSDTKTGLMWQGCPAGLSGSACVTGSPASHAWVAALAYCEDLDWGGHTDWALPDAKELGSIVDDRRVDPSIDPQVFPATPSVFFWASSSYAGNLTGAWGVSFYSTGVGVNVKVNLYGVRCVRRGP